ncbi:hypothetical protein RJ641_021211 [Dillenia turbinata]|uniref:Uncharacterized protein n=1 Tax=Dillenia turbinata TaxID=194707 RepID=A0AAN8YVG2_9MAGN
MEVAMEVEDAVFFADISKQISLLIMDDDEDTVTRPSVSLQGFSRTIHPTTPTPFLCEQSRRRESRGTGVFIPKTLIPRRKNRHGKFSSHNIKSNKPNDSSRLPPHVAYNYDSSYNNINSKKY